MFQPAFQPLTLAISLSRPQAMAQPIPVTCFTGFLGAVRTPPSLTHRFNNTARDFAGEDIHHPRSPRAAADGL